MVGQARKPYKKQTLPIQAKGLKKEETGTLIRQYFFEIKQNEQTIIQLANTGYIVFI
jgi:hypothetical protein